MKHFSGRVVKLEILSSGVLLWQVAEKLGLSDGNFSRRLRRDFSETEHQRIVEAIEAIKTGK